MGRETVSVTCRCSGPPPFTAARRDSTAEGLRPYTHSASAWKT